MARQDTGLTFDEEKFDSSVHGTVTDHAGMPHVKATFPIEPRPTELPEAVMTTGNARNLALAALVAVAPFAIVMIIALLRKYTITLHLSPEEKDRRPDNNSDDQPDDHLTTRHILEHPGRPRTPLLTRQNEGFETA